VTELYGGAIDDFDDSMAQEIEQALNDVRAEEGMDALPTGDRDRRMLFIAIARGVIAHLQSNSQAFEIEYQDDGTTRTTYPTIQVREP
jgi:hypothetical protein